jgi:hypothetical protein
MKTQLAQLPIFMEEKHYILKNSYIYLLPQKYGENISSVGKAAGVMVGYSVDKIWYLVPRIKK